MSILVVCTEMKLTNINVYVKDGVLNVTKYIYG